MNHTPKISVIIPNYNHGRYLKQRIDSVLNQGYEDFEVIILDDCSTDNSAEIIETYRYHPKISRILINSQNSGSPFLQWKKGIELAKGDWIWIAESDDWCEPNFLEELINKTNDKVAFAFCQSLMINQEGKKVLQTNWTSEYEEIDGQEFIENYLVDKNCVINASMCIFQKKYYEKISPEFVNYRLIGDWVFWQEMATQGKVAVSGKHLNYFRKHDADVSGKAFREGLIYTEYFKFLSSLKDDKILSAGTRRHALTLRFYEFLNDPNIMQEKRKPISSLFYTKLGIRFYLLGMKNWLVKNIKTPMKKLLGLRKPGFQNFTKFEQ